MRSKTWNWRELLDAVRRDRRVQAALGLGIIVIAVFALSGVLGRTRLSPLKRPGGARDVAVLGYFENGGDTAGFPPSLPSLKANARLLDAVSPFWYSVMPDGAVKPLDPKPEVVALARAGGLKVYPLFNNDKPTTGNVANAGALKTPSTRAKAVAAIVDIVKKSGYDGAHIDFELVPASSRNDLTAFITALRAALPKDKGLSVAVFPTVEIDRGIADAYDYVALARQADFLVMMAYDRHYESGPAGAVSPDPWVEANIKEFIRLGVPANKLVIAVGAYGYDWPASPQARGGRYVPANLALDLAKKQGAQVTRDAASGNPNFRYNQAGAERVIWFQDAEMLARRIAMARRYKLKGIAIWRLGFEEPSFWRTLEKELGPARGK
jgi:spore germination protein